MGGVKADRSNSGPFVARTRGFRTRLRENSLQQRGRGGDEDGISADDEQEVPGSALS